MVGSGPHPQESRGSHQQDAFHNLERRRDREGSPHTTQTSGSHPQMGNHFPQERSNRAMQREIDDLKRELRHAHRRRAPSSSGASSNDEDDVTYKRGHRTPSSEPFSYHEENVHKRKRKSPPLKGLENDAMSKALNQISRSPFTHRIERAELPRRFHQPTFTTYYGRTDPVEHVSQFNQKMAVYSKDEALMCKVFPSSLGPVAMRWFDGLRPNSISSFKELTQAFGSRFITCSRVPRPLDSLLSLSMREGETLKTYSDRYWETYNEIDGDFEDVAISTFKGGLPTEHGLRKSLTGKPVTSVRQLMDRISKYKRVEEDQQQGKGKTKINPQERRDFRSDRFSNNRPRRDFVGQSDSSNAQAVNAVFREPVSKVLEKIKNEPFFKWPNKMAGNAMRRNQSLYCQYHQDQGHTTEDCRNLWDHLDQLVREGRLKDMLHPSSRAGQTGFDSRRGASSGPPLGTINVIFAAPGRTGSCPYRVMSVAQSFANDSKHEPKRIKMEIEPVLGFSEEDKVGTIQPHDDALVITLRIGGYDVKRVLVDQGSAVEVMYPDLFRGLGLRSEDLTAYDSPLVSFEGRTVMPKGQIRLPVQAGLEVVEVDFIVVDVYSPYTAIVGRPWLHTLGAVSSTLHQKVKYPSEGQVKEIVGNQNMARQCLVAAISHQPEAESLMAAEASS